MKAITPNELALGDKCRVLRLPTDDALVEAINEALALLMSPYTWKQEGNKTAEETAQFMLQWWIDVHDSEHDCGTPPGTIPDECESCVDYAPDSRFIEYQPNNPHRTPDLTPPGYIYPPWAQAGEGNVLFDAGTVYTDLSRLPTDFLEIILSLDFAGFPRLKIRFSGTGRVLLYLRQIPLGGLALITIDGDPFASEFVDLSSVDLLALADWLSILEGITGDEIQGGLNSLRIVEVNIDSPGDHYIDITMLPKISTDNILGFGGALQKVEFCNFAAQETCPDCPEPEPIEPPQIRAGLDCVEWLNPTSNEWECIASYPELGLEKSAAVCDVCGCECESEDCMCNCSGVVKYDPCTGKLSYKNEAGATVELPVSQLTAKEGIPTAPDDEVPVSDNACYKANGVWLLIEKTYEAFTDVTAEANILGSLYTYPEFQLNHPEIDEDNDNLMVALTAYASGIDPGAIGVWNDGKDAFRGEFVCQMQFKFSKSSILTDADLDFVKNYEFATGDAVLDDVLEKVISIPESKQFKQYANNGVKAQAGNCDCNADHATDPNAPPEIPAGSSALLFRQFVGGINWTPGSKWASIPLALASAPRGSRVGSNVWQLQYDSFDDPNDGSIYSIGILLEFANVNATTLHKVNFQWQGNSGAGYTAPKVLWHTGVTPSSAWNEVIPSPDGHNPIPASQNYDITMNVSNVKYVAIWMNAVWSGASPLTDKVGRINSLYLDATVSGTRYNIIIPDQIITP